MINVCSWARFKSNCLNLSLERTWVITLCFSLSDVWWNASNKSPHLIDMTFWLLLRHEPTVQLVLWMKIESSLMWSVAFRWCCCCRQHRWRWRRKGANTSTARAVCESSSASLDKQIRLDALHICLCLNIGTIRNTIQRYSINGRDFHALEHTHTFKLHFQWDKPYMCCVHVTVISVFFLLLFTLKIWIDFFPIQASDGFERALRMEWEEKNDRWWDGTKNDLWYCTLAWLYI